MQNRKNKGFTRRGKGRGKEKGKQESRSPVSVCARRLQAEGWGAAGSRPAGSPRNAREAPTRAAWAVGSAELLTDLTAVW